MLLLVGCFYLCLYSVVTCGWALYFILYGLYKIYYLIFKYGAIGAKKLYVLIKNLR